jgi:HD-GYP domain-containing protein (c-di-GMP phosphodiesterase class II)
VSTRAVERVSRAEVVGALSLATDVGMNLPLESGLRICRLALALAESAGIDESHRDRIYYVALLRHVGCTADVHAFSAIVGDELTFHDGASRVDATSPRAMAAFTLRHLVRTNGLFGAAGKLAQMARAREVFQEGVVAVCEVAELLADQLGLDADVQRDLTLTIERWDGKSFMKRAKEDEIPPSVRVVHIAECATIYDSVGGPDAARTVVRERAGAAFDPRIAEVFAANAETLLAPAAHLWAEVVADPAYDAGPLSDEEVDAGLQAIAQFVDLKSPFTVGHSPAVARLAAAAAEQAGLPASDAAALARSGLMHDLGMVGVPSPVLEKHGPLTTDERERVRLHTYHGERIVAQSPPLSALGAVAFRHHERCDGGGYHRGLDARSISQSARLLAAADAYQSMTEARPYRAALTADASAEELRIEARAGRLDGDAVECVLAAATGRRRRRPEHAGGLTARELEVLRLLARGLSTKQIAARLVITPKTADSHIQHVYSKIGVSTRAAATVFAMRHDLVDAAESSGELPM